MGKWSDSAIIKGITYNRGDKVNVIGSAEAHANAYGSYVNTYSGLKTKTNYFYGKYSDSSNPPTHPYHLSVEKGVADGYYYTEDAFPAGTYTITYNKNGGSDPPPTGTKTYNAVYTISSIKPTKTGAKFLGWSTSSTATSAEYFAGDTISASTNKNITLYAVYQDYCLTINYYSGGATAGSFQGTEISDLNSCIGQSKFYYSKTEENGLWDIQTKENEWLYLEKRNYEATGFWLYNGIRINETSSYSGATLAEALGLNLTQGNISIDIIPEWEPIIIPVENPPIVTETVDYVNNTLTFTIKLNLPENSLQNIDTCYYTYKYTENELLPVEILLTNEEVQKLLNGEELTFTHALSNDTSYQLFVYNKNDANIDSGPYYEGSVFWTKPEKPIFISGFKKRDKKGTPIITISLDLSMTKANNRKSLTVKHGEKVAGLANLPNLKEKEIITFETTQKDILYITLTGLNATSSELIIQPEQILNLYNVYVKVDTDNCNVYFNTDKIKTAGGKVKFYIPE